jgi:DNA-binding response OmpR family regulator
MESEPKNEYKGTILIVDDEPDVVFFISKIFQPRGYHTITAGSGVQALKYLNELRGKIDLVLLDLRMPEMGGLQVLRVMRQDFTGVPVMILTAYGEDREKVEQIGVDGFMTKPYSLETLCQKVESVLARQEFDKAALEPEEGTIPAAKVLIVDDEKDVCDFLEESFRDVTDAEFQVRTALSGEDALRIACEFEPDIAIVDIKMPHMWGDELISRFKRGDAPCPKDFIVFTAVSDTEGQKKAQALGHKLLSKPGDFEKVLAVVRKTCVQYRLLKPKPKAKK